MKILIDNGHGINTPGKRSPDGELLEGIYNREIARRITTKLQYQGIDAEHLWALCKRLHKEAISKASIWEVLPVIFWKIIMHFNLSAKNIILQGKLFEKEKGYAK